MNSSVTKSSFSLHCPQPRYPLKKRGLIYSALNPQSLLSTSVLLGSAFGTCEQSLQWGPVGAPACVWRQPSRKPSVHLKHQNHPQNLRDAATHIDAEYAVLTKFSGLSKILDPLLTSTGNLGNWRDLKFILHLSNILKSLQWCSLVWPPHSQQLM